MVMVVVLVLVLGYTANVIVVTVKTVNNVVATVSLGACVKERNLLEAVSIGRIEGRTN